MSPIGTAMPETEEKTRKPMGRPPKAPEKGRRQNYTFRMSDETRDRVIKAAASSGRSMSEELEWRIEEGFRNDDRQVASSSLLNGSRSAYSLVSKITAAISYIENLNDRSGFSLGSLDWSTHEPTRAGIRAALDSLIASATEPVREPDENKLRQKKDTISKKISSDTKLSKGDEAILRESHEEMLIEAMKTHGRLIAAILSGSIGIDQLERAFPAKC